MKVAICHDTTIFLDDDGNYYKISMGDEYYERYRVLGDQLIACVRTKSLRDSKFIPRYHISLKEFRVVSCPPVNSLYSLIFYRKKTSGIIEEQIKNADYVVSCLPGWIGNEGCTYARKYKKPLYVEIGGCAWDAYWNHGITGKIMAPYFYFTTRRNVKLADYVLYVTNSFLQKRYPANGANISCSNVNLEKINENVLKQRLEKIDSKKAEEKIIVGTIGSLDVVYKGQKYVIKTLAKLKAKGMGNYEYQLVGKGDKGHLYRIAQKYNVADQVKFLGTKTHDEIFQWLKTIDIYIQPSKTEGLPRSLIEAMSCGVPSLGATVGGIPELLSKDALFQKHGMDRYEIYNAFMRFRRKELLKKEAIGNFNRAQDYEKEKLKIAREKFLEDFGKRREVQKEILNL